MTLRLDGTDFADLSAGNLARAAVVRFQAREGP